MKLEEIQDLWSKDCKMDKSALDDEALKIPQLHNKYYKIFIQELMLLKKKECNYNQLIKDKTEYYSGKTPQEDLKERGWKQFDLVVLKADIPTYLNADQELIDALMSLAQQREKCNFLESILKTLNNRGFQIKSAIDFIKWTQGSG